ncbi:hypothetical protein GCM10027076_22760 [Nocardioides montaniterrae]
MVGRPLSSDEAGFLIVGGQWGHGSSLYGNYWVDRPPVLIGIYEIAAALGGAVPLRLIGILALLMSCLAAYAIGRLVSDWRWAAPLAVAVPAVLLSDPLFGANEVDGELLAAPFILLGLYAVLRALADLDGPRRRRLWWLAASAAGVCAVSIKQNMAEVFVAAGVGVIWLAWRRQARAAVEGAAIFGVGSIAFLGGVLGFAAARGTSPSGLFDAVVTFRGEASHLIRTQASAATSERAAHVAEAFFGSFAWLLGVLAVISALIWWRRRADHLERLPLVPLGAITAAIMLWEAIGVIAGGSYWLHYLIGTVPGSVLIVAGVVRAHLLRVRWLAAAYVVIAVVAVPSAFVDYGHPGTSGDKVAEYLRTHDAPGQSAVVVFGQSNVLEGTGLHDPYEHLWSLPVRVRDPHLIEFMQVLRQEPPTWIIVPGTEIDTWAVDSTAANVYLHAHYRDVAQIGEWHVFKAVAPGASAR